MEWHFEFQYTFKVQPLMGHMFPEIGYRIPRGKPQNGKSDTLFVRIKNRALLSDMFFCGSLGTRGRNQLYHLQFHLHNNQPMFHSTREDEMQEQIGNPSIKGSEEVQYT